MHIKTNYKIRIEEDIYDSFYEDIQDNIEDFKKQVKLYINLANNLITADFTKLSNSEFYKLLQSLYNISFEPRDYLKIISKVNNREYCCFDNMDTTMTFKSTATEGHGRDFSWWNDQLYQVKYDIAIADGFNFNPDHVYTKKQIKQMLKNNDIVIVNENNVPNDYPEFKQEKREIINFQPLCIENNFLCEDNHYFDVGISLLRKNITKKRILKDLKEYIIDLQSEISKVLSHDFDVGYKKEVADECKKWFNKSEEKNNLAKLLIKLQKKDN